MNVTSTCIINFLVQKYSDLSSFATVLILNFKQIGRGRVLREGSKVAVLGFGAIVQNCIGAADLLQEHKVSATVADARFCKPLDGELIKRLAREHEILITVEEGSIGGFGSHVSHFLALNGLLDGNLKVKKNSEFL